MTRHLTVATLSALAASAWACSGPNIQEDIAASLASTLVGFAASLALTAFAFLLRLPVARAVCLVLLAVHPQWTIGDCCDCGMTKMTASLLVAILSLGVFAWDLLRRKGARSV